MNIAFVCAKQDSDAWPDEAHETDVVMRACTRCGQHAIAGYRCADCGHEDVAADGHLSGHGPGVCDAPPGLP